MEVSLKFSIFHPNTWPCFVETQNVWELLLISFAALFLEMVVSFRS
jgi:hypothetical protein